MPRHINDQQFESVSALPGAARYIHFVTQVADWQEVWSLRHDDDGWVLLGEPAGGHECVPVWPHARYAQAFATGSFAGARATAIPLDAWMVRWLAGIAAEGRLVAVFPVAADHGVVVAPERLRDDLEAELLQYE